MRILFCTSTFEHINHGPAKFANLLLDINATYPEHELRVLTEDISEYKVDTYNGLVYRLDLKLNPIQNLVGLVYRMKPYYRQAAAIKQEYDYDILVFNNAIIGIESAKKLTIPVVGMINDDNSLTTSLSNFELNKRWFRSWIFKYFESVACKTEARIIVNSKFLLKEVKEAYDIQSKRISKLYKSVDVKGIRFVLRNGLQENIKVLFVKSNYYNGGLFDLLDALGSLTRYTFNLRIVGPEKASFHSIEKYAINKGYKNLSMNILGRLNQEEVFKEMHEADIFSVPSKQEALGVANIEALMHGLPVVATSAGGIPEVLGYGRYGWLAKPSDHLSLAEAFQHCLDDEEDRKRRTSLGNDHVRRKFNKEVMLDKFVSIMESVLVK
ncbi:hypothetical protein GCM10009122_56090 [Fulvivirga kasyanovii]